MVNYFLVALTLLLVFTETGGHNTAYINRLYSINSCVQGILEELGDLVTESTIIALQSDPTTPVEYSTLVSNSYPGLLSKV